MRVNLAQKSPFAKGGAARCGRRGILPATAFKCIPKQIPPILPPLAVRRRRRQGDCSNGAAQAEEALKILSVFMVFFKLTRMRQWRDQSLRLKIDEQRLKKYEIKT
jgi:hypothetical protein